MLAGVKGSGGGAAGCFRTSGLLGFSCQCVTAAEKLVVMSLASSSDPVGTATMRELARAIFLRTLRQCTVQSAFGRHVRYESGALRVCEDLYSLADYQSVSVISIGKAAHTMAEAVAGQLGRGIGGIIAAPVDPKTQLHGFRYYKGGHPLPNDDSLRAARDMLHLAERQNEDSFLIYLISGGGSAVVESPISEDIGLDDLRATYRALVDCGAGIAEINVIRKHLSAVKGGRLAQAAAPAQQVSILISDVPDNALDALASGPTMPDSSTLEDCYAIASRYELTRRFPQSVAALFEERALEETPKPNDAAFARARWWPVLSNGSALEIATEQARQAGFHVAVDNSCDDWDYARAADYLLGRLRELRREGPQVCLLSGGEVTVKLENGGKGGRNQQFALYCASRIAKENIVVLSAGTDGIDGTSEAAGAVVDGSTQARAQAAGRSVEDALARFDAYPLLNALGDAIMTGPTGNNVRDLRFLMAY
jgi:glycerate 2-kinase